MKWIVALLTVGIVSIPSLSQSPTTSTEKSVQQQWEKFQLTHERQTYAEGFDILKKLSAQPRIIMLTATGVSAPSHAQSPTNPADQSLQQQSEQSQLTYENQNYAEVFAILKQLSTRPRITTLTAANDSMPALSQSSIEPHEQTPQQSSAPGPAVAVSANTESRR